MLSLMSQTDPVRQWIANSRSLMSARPFLLELDRPASPRAQSPFSLSPWFSADLAMPLGPIWPGLAVNTLFYAAILWLLIPAPFALRRFLRVGRGLCPKCAYPAGESAVCTECGRLLPKRVAT